MLFQAQATEHRPPSLLKHMHKKCYFIYPRKQLISTSVWEKDWVQDFYTTSPQCPTSLATSGTLLKISYKLSVAFHRKSSMNPGSGTLAPYKNSKMELPLNFLIHRNHSHSIQIQALSPLGILFQWSVYCPQNKIILTFNLKSMFSIYYYFSHFKVGFLTIHFLKG